MFDIITLMPRLPDFRFNTEQNLHRLAVIAGLSGVLALTAACGGQEAPRPIDRCLIAPLASVSLHETATDKSEFSAEPDWVQDFCHAPDGPVDKSIWHHELDPVVPTYNDEAQAYTDNLSNVRIENGKLIIEAHRENYTDPAGREVEYTSGRIDTRGSFSFEYGKVEVTMILPEGAGAWPAFWFLSANNPYTSKMNLTKEDWEKDRTYLHDGELDAAEAGEDGNTTRIEGTAHTFRKSVGGHVTIPDATNRAHTYGVEVTPNKIVWTVDGRPFKTFKKPSNNPESWPFGNGNKFYLILNLAMGGNFPGQIDPSHDHWQMQVGSIKYYKYLGG